MSFIFIQISIVLFSICIVLYDSGLFPPPPPPPSRSFSLSPSIYSFLFRSSSHSYFVIVDWWRYVRYAFWSWPKPITIHIIYSTILHTNKYSLTNIYTYFDLMVASHIDNNFNLILSYGPWTIQPAIQSGNSISPSRFFMCVALCTVCSYTYGSQLVINFSIAIAHNVLLFLISYLPNTSVLVVAVALTAALLASVVAVATFRSLSESIWKTSVMCVHMNPFFSSSVAMCVENHLWVTREHRRFSSHHFFSLVFGFVFRVGFYFLEWF